MKKSIILSALVAAVFGTASTASAQVSATATATATIVTPISITKTVDMNFGNVAVDGSTAGTVVFVPGGTRTSTGGVTLPSTAGTVTAASFTVNGTGTYTYAITLPTSSVSLSDGASHTMTVTTFASTPSGTG